MEALLIELKEPCWITSVSVLTYIPRLERRKQQMPICSYEYERNILR